MNQVLGKNVITSMLIGGIYYPIFCGKSASFTLNQDEIEVTHVNSGAGREYVPGMSNATLQVQGVTVLDNTESKISNLYLMQEAIRRSINTYRMLFTDQDGSTASIIFNAFWTTGTLSREVTAWSQSDVTMRVTGAITFSSVIPVPVPPSCEEEDPIYTTLIEAATSVTSALLIPGVGETITILHVSRSGFTHYETTGTPGSLEFKYTSATGTIDIDPINPGNVGGEPISIQYKIEV
jgi:hypothetical protein